MTEEGPLLGDATGLEDVAVTVDPRGPGDATGPGDEVATGVPGAAAGGAAPAW